MKRFAGSCLVLLAAGFAASDARAERGATIRAGELKAQPFLDAATTATVTANQPVTIVRRQGAWAQVESSDKTGWIRMLNLRLQVAAAAPGAVPARPAARSSGLGSLLRTGSSGKTVTTGIKGLGEEDIRNATVNEAELQRLAALAVAPAEAASNAQQSGLHETKIDYLKERGRK